MVPTDPLKEMMIFGVSRGVSTGPLEEVMIFGVSRGVPTDLLEEVMNFGVSWGAHELTFLRKWLFLVSHRGSQLTLEVLIFCARLTF